MSSGIYRRRYVLNILALSLSGLATLLGLTFLAWILWVTLSRGISAFSAHLFTRITAYADQGGLANAIAGSLIIDLMAIAICAPIGVLAGTYLAEFASRTRLGATIRFLNDILLSAPLIVLGLFVYVIVVLPFTTLTDGAVTFSAFAGAVALALIGLPVIVRTTDEMLQLVPSTLREAALSLGIPQWKLTLQVLMRAAGSGILTGGLLALARLAGGPRRCCSGRFRQQLHDGQAAGQNGQPADDDLPVHQRPKSGDACHRLGRRAVDCVVRARAEPAGPIVLLAQEGEL